VQVESTEALNHGVTKQHKTTGSVMGRHFGISASHVTYRNYEQPERVSIAVKFQACI
jgi:hypothetical protein